MKRKIKISLFLLLAGLIMSGIVMSGISLTLTPTAGEDPQSSFASSGTNDMSSDNLLPGDVILLGTDDSKFDYLIPGKWSHTVIFGGISDGTIPDTENGGYVPAGEAWVVHSTKDDTDSGLRTSRFSTVVNEHAGNVVALRILKPGGALMSASERQGIVDFATSKIGQDEGYDWNWVSKQVGIDTADPEIAPDGYYCSELAWAAYKSVLGIDLDGDFSPFDIGVSPEDLYWSQYAQTIALEMNADPNDDSVPNDAYAVDASNDLYKISVYVDEVYYEDEHEGWLMGDGEMYLELKIGEAYFPSCASGGDISDNHLDNINDAGSDTESAGSGEALNWDNQHYALFSYDSYAKVRVQASESDSTSGDDDYSAFQWFWSPSEWHGYVDNGWYWTGDDYDVGDCRYTIWFRIDSVY